MARVVGTTQAGARSRGEILRSAQNDSSDILRRPPRVILSGAKNLAMSFAAHSAPPSVILSGAKNLALPALKT